MKSEPINTQFTKTSPNMLLHGNCVDLDLPPVFGPVIT